MEGLDYTEPAFSLEFAVEDDKCWPHMTYCVGTYTGGCDVVKNEPLDGLSSIMTKVEKQTHFYYNFVVVALEIEIL